MRLALALAALTLVTAAKADDTAVRGAGTVKCEGFTFAQKDADPKSKQLQSGFIQFANGYLAALVVEAPDDKPKPDFMKASRQEIEGWLTRYCEKHPDRPFFVAVFQLARNLRSTPIPP